MNYKRKDLEEMFSRVLRERGLVYGQNMGEYHIAYTDSRCAPYLYRVEKVINAGGGVHGVSDAMTARECAAWINGLTADLN
mgnify:CR=1 FL=1